MLVLIYKNNLDHLLKKKIMKQSILKDKKSDFNKYIENFKEMIDKNAY